MKRARVVEIPDRTLTFEEFDDLYSHAIKSSNWYLSKYPAHSVTVANRLYKKGYPKGEVTYVDITGEECSTDIVKYAVKTLKNSGLLDDERFIEKKINSGLSKGKGISLVIRELSFTGIDRDEIESVVAQLNLQESEIDAIEKAASKEFRKSSFQKLNSDNQKYWRMRSALFAKGFDENLVLSWLSENMDY